MRREKSLYSIFVFYENILRVKEFDFIFYEGYRLSNGVSGILLKARNLAYWEQITNIKKHT